MHNNANYETISKMKKKLTQKSLFQSLEDVIPAIQDGRKQDHTIHSLRDAIFVSFSGFFLQSRSLKGHINFLKKAKAEKNKKSLFKIQTVPTDTHVRNLIDPIPTSHFEKAQDDMIFKMQRSLVLRDFKVSIGSGDGKIEMGHLIGMDGFEYFRSKSVCCDHCCRVHQYVNQEGFGALRKANATLYECFEAIRGIFLLVTCVSWEQFYDFAKEGIDLDSS